MGSSMGPRYFIEMVFISICVPPKINIFFTLQYMNDEYIMPIDYYISVIMFGRLYIILRLYKNLSMWTNGRAERICNMNGFEPDGSYALKASLTANPMPYLTAILFGALGVFGLIVRNLEKTYLYSGRTYQFDFPVNAIWLQVLTTTTVGYGEIFPVTNLGRFFTIQSAIVGIFVCSLLIVAQSDAGALNTEQTNTYEEICGTSQIKKKLKNDAITFIQMWMRYSYYKNRCSKYTPYDRMQVYLKYVSARQAFSFKRISYIYTPPTVEESIEKIMTISTDYAEKYNRRLCNVKNDVWPQMETLRDKQYTIDVSFMKLFAVNQKCQSYQLKANDSSSKNVKCPEYEQIDDVVKLYDAKGKKGKKVQNFYHYKNKFMEANEPLKKFYDQVDDFNMKANEPENPFGIAKFK